MATRDLLVRVLGDSRSLERTFVKSTATGKVFGREMEVVGRKTDKAFSGLKGLSSGRGLAGGLFAAAAISGLKQVVGAASNAQQVLGQTRVALGDAGLSWEKYGASVEAAATSLTKLGFDDEETLKIIATFSRATGDVDKALRLAALSADVARARYIDLGTASTIVLKASLGQAGALRRIGIDAKNGASGIELLTLLSQKYGGSATAAAQDATTANERLQVSLQNVQETIGSGALPLVSALANSLADGADSASILAEKLKGLGVSFDFPTKSGKLLNHTLTDYITFYPILKDVLGGTKKQVLDLGAAFDKTQASAKAFSTTFGIIGAQGVKPGFVPEPAALLGFTPGNFKIPAVADRRKKSGLTADQRNQFFDNALARSLDRVQDADLKAQVTKLRTIEATIQKRIDATRDVTRKLNLEDQLVSVRRQRKGVEQQISDVLSQRIADAKAAKIEEKAKELEALRKRQEAALAKLQSRQFRALGLSAEGGDIVPGVENLRKQLASLTDRLAGASVNLSSKLESQLAGVRKVLSGQLGKATEESRAKIQELFATIRGEFDKGAKGPLDKIAGLDTKKIIKGLGLSTDQASELRGRLANVNASGFSIAGSRNTPTGGFVGGRPIVVESHTTIQLDGHTVGKSITRSQQKTKRRNPAQRRGPNRPF